MFTECNHQSLSPQTAGSSRFSHTRPALWPTQLPNGPFPGINYLEHEADHSTSIAQKLMCYRSSVSKHRENFTVYLIFLCVPSTYSSFWKFCTRKAFPQMCYVAHTWYLAWFRHNNNKLISLRGPVTIAERSKACTVFARLEAGIVSSNPTQGFLVFVYVFFCVCIQVEALRRADHPHKESYRLSKI
jgi:hypothetical protein